MKPYELAALLNKQYILFFSFPAVVDTVIVFLCVIYFSFNPDPRVRNTFWTLTLGGAFTAMPVWTVSQSAVQRFLAIRTYRDAKKYSFCFCFFLLFIHVL